MAKVVVQMGGIGRRIQFWVDIVLKKKINSITFKKYANFVIFKF